MEEALYMLYEGSSVKTLSCGYCKKFQNAIERTDEFRVCLEGRKVTATDDTCGEYEKNMKFYCPLDLEYVDCIACQWQRQLIYFGCLNCYNFANDPPEMEHRITRPGRKPEEVVRYDCIKRPDVVVSKAVCKMNKKMDIDGCAECDVLDEYRRPRR